MLVQHSQPPENNSVSWYKTARRSDVQQDKSLYGCDLRSVRILTHSGSNIRTSGKRHLVRNPHGLIRGSRTLSPDHDYRNGNRHSSLHPEQRERELCFPESPTWHIYGCGGGARIQEAEPTRR